MNESRELKNAEQLEELLLLTEEIQEELEQQIEKGRDIDERIQRIKERRTVCIFRKNCASVPEERSAIPLQTEQSSAG